MVSFFICIYIEKNSKIMLKERKIKLSGNEYIIKQNFKSMKVFEQVAGKKIQNVDDSITDTLTVFYSMIKANNPVDWSLDDFIEVLDSNDNSFNSFTDFLIDVQNETEIEPEVKKKGTKKN
jgi:hypothetical protein